MKKKTLLLCSAILLVSCGSSTSASSFEVSKIDISNSIELMRNTNFNVTFEGEISYTYPKEYSSYNQKSNVRYSRDYGFAEGKKAIRIYNEEEYSSYFKSDDGKIYSEYMNIDNTVGNVYKQTLGKFYLFDDTFSQPFDYLTKKDFEGYKLGSDKAYFLFKSFTDFSQPVKSAMFNFLDNGFVDTIDVEFLPYPIGFSVSENDVKTISQEMTGSFKFTYDIKDFKHLTPYEDKSSSYETALNNLGSNYTITIDSNALEYQLVTYVTSDKVLIHMNGNINTPLNNDKYYVKKGTSYRAYIYNGSSWAREENCDIKDVLLHPDLISSNVVDELNSTHLKIKEKATAYAGENFILPYLGITSGTCLRTDIYLKDNKFNYITSNFYYYTGNINMKTVFTDYNETSLPIWFEAPTF